MNSTDRIPTEELIHQLKNVHRGTDGYALVQLCNQAARNIESQIRAIHVARMLLIDENKIAKSAIKLLFDYATACDDNKSTSAQIESMRREAIAEATRLRSILESSSQTSEQPLSAEINVVADYKCLECGFTGSVQVINRKAICPCCGTVNDVWQEGEAPPSIHLEDELRTAEIVRALRCLWNHEDGSTKPCKSCQYADGSLCNAGRMAHDAADRLEILKQEIAELRATLKVTCENWSDSSKQKNGELADLTMRAKTYEVERDAAYRIVRNYYANNGCGECGICASEQKNCEHFPQGAYRINGCKHFSIDVPLVTKIFHQLEVEVTFL